MPRMIWLANTFVQFRTSPRLALAVEIACLIPALALVAVAGFAWGGYFCLQHRVQAAAERGLDAALTAPDPDDARTLARAAAQRVLGAPTFDLDLLTGRGGRPMVRIAYDASRSPVFTAAAIGPMPPSVIVRLAARP